MRRFWFVLFLLLVVLGGALWLGARQLWAWNHFHAAEDALERYHSEEAREHLKACLEVWPASAPTHLLACRAARRTADYEQAEQHLHECQRLEGEPSPESTLEELLLHATTGDLEGNVESDLETWMEKDPAQKPLIWEALAEGYLRMYRIRDALSCLNQWLREQPDNVQALFLHGNVWRQVGSLRRAVPNYRQAAKLDPERWDARKWLAFSLMEIGQFDEAITHLNALRRQQPHDPEVLVRLARCHSKLGKIDPAQRLLAEVLADHPRDGLALRTRGQLALMEKKPRDAEHWFTRAVRVWPHDYDSQYGLYLALSQQGKAAAAEQSKITEDIKKRKERIRKIQSQEMSRRPHDPALHCELGTLLLRVGYRDLGLKWLSSALHQDRHYAPAHAALAKYYAAHDEPARAAFHRQRAGNTAAPSTRVP